MDLEGIFAIVFIFGSIPFIVWATLNHKFKIRSKSAELIAAMIAKDKEITPDLVKAVGFVPKRPHADLRLGLILLAIGLAFFVLGGLIPEDEAQGVMGGIAMFPIFIAIALLTFWYFVSRKENT